MILGTREMIKYFLLISSLMTVSQGVMAERQDVVHVDRYTMYQAKPTSAQKDLLAVMININMPDHVDTVGDTFQHLLERSGYSLASIEASDPALPILLSKPLPIVHRHLGPMSLRSALSTLAGPAWQLIEDPVNRMVSFQLQDKYSNFRPVVTELN